MKPYSYCMLDTMYCMYCMIPLMSHSGKSKTFGQDSSVVAKGLELIKELKRNGGDLGLFVI